MAPRPLTDEELAMQLYSEELSNASFLDSDRKMAMSLQEAVQSDEDAIRRAEREEKVAQSDRQYSVSLFVGNGVNPVKIRTIPRPPPAPRPRTPDAELYNRLKALYINGNPSSSSNGKKTSSSAAAQKSRPKEENSRPESQAVGQLKTCVCCQTETNSAHVMRAPCQHEYCRVCLTELFSRATKDESSFPPRCCGQAIPLDSNKPYLRREVIRKFEAKAVEFSVPNRTYCHKPTCSAFIHPSDIREGVAHCASCKSRTCANCKAAAHVGYCPKDPEVQKVLQMARREKWQRCPTCHNIIELATGCYHMKCPCGTEFCYLCSKRWKTCLCRRWDEARL
ncbi:hypothetical protein F4809DRAFT_653403 [Biscogniauxia mediterranea]|nr:hypothetical protein F4809DRAFT_653403 [Biscogniauxia mediterranea]